MGSPLSIQQYVIQMLFLAFILFFSLVTFIFARFIRNVCMVLIVKRRFSVLLTLMRNSLNLDAVVMLQHPSLYSVRKY